MHKSLRLRTAASATLLLTTAALTLSACSSTGAPQKTVTVTKGNGDTTTVTSGAAGAPATTPSPTKTAKPAKPVRIQAYPGDGATVGVGMPIIATFDRKITNGVAFQKYATVTLNGKPAKGAWFFEYTDPRSGHKMEAHYRLKDFWPAHSKVHVAFATAGKSAGKGLAFKKGLTSLDYQIGDRNVVTVDDSSHSLNVVSDGKQWGKFPVSLGANDTPTRRGTKVIMEQGASICMSGPGYSECGVKFTQRLTYDGEYLHAAPWNTSNIGRGVDSSNGCTNLYTSDAEKLFRFLKIGDVVEYPNANGDSMDLGDGYGDWNVSWQQWQTGGVVPTS